MKTSLIVKNAAVQYVVDCLYLLALSSPFVHLPGLPPDTSSDEFAEMMSKCGIVMRDPITEEYKVKLYKDKEGNLKGDGLCCYLKVSCSCCSLPSRRYICLNYRIA